MDVGMMDPENEKRIEEIRRRLEEYKKHYNDPYAYYHDEIDAVRELKGHAPEDIEFLLNWLQGTRRALKTARRIIDMQTKIIHHLGSRKAHKTRKKR